MIEERRISPGIDAVLVEVGGKAYYTGRSVFTRENDDLLSTRGISVI